MTTDWPPVAPIPTYVKAGDAPQPTAEQRGKLAEDAKSAWPRIHNGKTLSKPEHLSEAEWEGVLESEARHQKYVEERGRPPLPPRMITAEEARQAWEREKRNPESGWYEPPDAEILAGVYDFLGRFVSYPSEAAHVAHTLWIGHTWFMDSHESTPRIAFLSPEPGSGKSRALEVTEPLVPRPVHAVNTTPAYLFRKVSDEAGLPTILYDEIDTVFGPKAKDNEDIRGMLNAGHRKGAVAGRCVVKGKTVVTEELPAYCAVALAGLATRGRPARQRPPTVGRNI